MPQRIQLFTGAAVVLAGLALALTQAAPPPSKSDPHPEEKPIPAGYEWALPDESLKTPFKDEQPILFLNRNQDAKGWDALPAFWNKTTEKTVDPKTGRPIERAAVVIKVPLGLNSNPPVPVENPMTVAKWALGKKLYFSTILSSDASVSCSSCHEPTKGFTDRSPFSTGIKSLKGGMSAPTVFNTAYQPFQFWDGRASSLEDQSQGPVQNPVEMFGGDGHAWNSLVERLRARPEYVQQFKAVFGTLPTRDGVAKAIATYERTVLSGNSIHDRADLVMHARVDADESGKFEFKASDYETALKAAFAAKDVAAHDALELTADDAAKAPAVAESLLRGRNLYFGKARCNSCHVGDNFTDNAFHNLGVGVRDGKLPESALGRFGSQPIGQKDPALVGAFKTPTLRHLLGTAPYLHDGSEDTLAKVVDFYDRGGNANEFLDPKMRSAEAEAAYAQSVADGTEYKGPPVKLFGAAKTPIVPLALNLTPAEKTDLVLFLRALQGDPADPIVADKTKLTLK